MTREALVQFWGYCREDRGISLYTIGKGKSKMPMVINGYAGPKQRCDYIHGEPPEKGKRCFLPKSAEYMAKRG
jgi:hypothetical protein